ncbi:hypothetical protein HAX54_033718 [Datura stramonium]|uniref:Uncharacterized protein n=1 Tax=Datura stramonium TaxID=4076 RepID=A0ABS8VCT9_DATST|nr:hypothetical protein [Datura stramonium]
MIFSEKVKQQNVGSIRLTTDASPVKVQFGDDDIRRFAGGVQQNASGKLVQGIVGFRPLFGSRVASMVRRSIPATHRLVASSPRVYSVFYLISPSHQRFADSSCDPPVFHRCC